LLAPVVLLSLLYKPTEHAMFYRSVAAVASC
jgi:hypothetical protein